MPRNQGTSRKGKPKKNDRAAGMGRALQKSQTHRRKPKPSEGGMAMTAGVESINIQQEDNRASVLEMNDLDDFLLQAEMANREFVSEREQMVILDQHAQQAEEERTKTITWSDEAATTKSMKDFAFQELSVPRRPAWDATTTPAQLDKAEKESFLEWRRAIAKKEEEIVLKSGSSLGVTPFEKNIEIWRQLWRVLERCSCIVQIVDARNPLFYLSQDLKRYTTDELNKPMLLLINKSDYLTKAQRQAWHDYFTQQDHQWDHVFFSAHDEQQKLDHPTAGAVTTSDTYDTEAVLNLDNVGVNNPLSRTKLIDWLRTFATKHNCQRDHHHDRIPFGMVGFPNVGKSSVINVLMGNSRNSHGVVRVGVAAQPGKTKHFQTLLLPDKEDVLLCDCPGLVFPSFVNNTADLIAAGVYPIAQMRDPYPVVNLLCKRIPRDILNAQYGIQIPLPSADAMLEASSSTTTSSSSSSSKNGQIPPPTAEEFLATYCVARSMLAASSGVPDYPRAARIVIKDYASGKLLYCHSPPNIENEQNFQNETLVTLLKNTKKLRDKLIKAGGTSAISKQSNTTHEEPVEDDDNDDDDDDNDNDIPLEEDDILLDLMGEASSGAKPNDTQNPTRKKKWGKKGRKIRNKDPYGCHSTPDDMLAAQGGASVGLVVNAGKYGRKGYTRPTGYGNARSQG